MPRRPHRYVMTPLTVLFDNRLSPTARTVYSVLVYFAYPGTVCTAKAKEIAESLDVTPKTLWTAIAELELHQYIARPADATKKGPFVVELIAQKSHDPEPDQSPDRSEKIVRPVGRKLPTQDPDVGRKLPTQDPDVGRKLPTQGETVGRKLPTGRKKITDPILLEKKENNTSYPLPPEAGEVAGSDDEPFISTPDEWPPLPASDEPQPDLPVDCRGRPILRQPALPGREHWPEVRNDRETVKAVAAWAEQEFPMIGIDARVLKAGGVGAQAKYWAADLVAALGETKRYEARYPWNYCCSILDKWMDIAQGHPTHGEKPTLEDLRRLALGDDEPDSRRDGGYFDPNDDDD